MSTSTLATLPYRDNLRMATLVSQGLPTAALRELAEALGLSASNLASIVRIATRTLARRQHRLKADEAERVLRLGQLLRMADEVFADREAAVRWFRRPLRVLGGKSPLQLCATEFGAKEVEQTLGRIAHGVFS